MTRFRRNTFFQDQLDEGLLPPAPPGVRAFHQSLPGYAPTPLVRLNEITSQLGVNGVWLKDESARFGLNAFKILGASYALHRFLLDHPAAGRCTFATATDGNHGRAVAWAARRLGHAAVVFVPQHTAQARIAAIEGEGARVIVVDGTYDDAVAFAATEAAANGWHVTADTGYPGYLRIPDWIMEGYATLFDEAIDQMAAAGARWPDVVVLQAGVGGLACAGVRFFRRQRGKPLPRMVVVEPVDADCLFESISSPGGSIREGTGAQRSIMAGLNCGMPSLSAWPLLRVGIDAFVAIDDSCAEDAMRRLARAGVTAGESGAAGVAGLIALIDQPGARTTLNLSADATVLVISTEGATDPVNWSRIVTGTSRS